MDKQPQHRAPVVCWKTGRRHELAHDGDLDAVVLELAHDGDLDAVVLELAHDGDLDVVQYLRVKGEKGKLYGEVTLPDHTGPATPALVFMLAGTTTRWKQVVIVGDYSKGRSHWASCY